MSQVTEFFFSSRRRHTRYWRDWSSDVCSSDLGIGVEEIKAALASPDPLTRRGAARIFAYQFQGMDERLDILGQFLTLTRSEERRVGKEWRYRVQPDNGKKT